MAAVPALLVPPAHPEDPDLPAQMARKEHQARQAAAQHRAPETQDPLERMEDQAPPAAQVPLETTEDPAQPDPRDRPEQPATQVATVAPATKAHQVPTETRANRVSVPSTAPPTEVSSSRMAQGDKREYGRPFATPHTFSRHGTPLDNGLGQWFNNYCLFFVIIYVSSTQARRSISLDS